MSSFMTYRPGIRPVQFHRPFVVPPMAPAARKRPGARGQAGITLVEMLVVAAIASMLTSVLVPLGVRARRNAQELCCQGHLRQIWLAYQMAARDGDRDIVDLSPADLAPYIEPGTLRCPVSEAPGSMAAIHRSYSDYVRSMGWGFERSEGSVGPDSRFLFDPHHCRSYRGPWIVLTIDGKVISEADRCRDATNGTEDSSNPRDK